MFAEGEQQNGLRVGVQLGGFALEVDAAHQGGVIPVGAGIGAEATWRGVVLDPSAVQGAQERFTCVECL